MILKIEGAIAHILENDFTTSPLRDEGRSGGEEGPPALLLMRAKGRSMCLSELSEGEIGRAYIYISTHSHTYAYSSSQLCLYAGSPL